MTPKYSRTPPSSAKTTAFAENADPSDHWSAVTDLTGVQWGVVGNDQLRRVGIAASQVRSWVRRGSLVRAAPRVWRLVGAPVTWEQRLWTGLLSLGPASRISHEAAAQFHRFDRTPPDRAELTVLRSAKGSRVGLLHDVTVHSTESFGRTDTVHIDGLPVTSATRTILDLARQGRDRDRLAAAIDSAIRSGASSPLVLQRRLSERRGPGHWGCRLLDELLVDAGGHSMLERRFLELVRAAALPRPRRQQVFRDGTRTIARTDFWWPDQNLVVEVSGRLGHSSPSDRARDAQRRNELQDAGVRVYEYTWEDVTRRPYRVVAQLTALLCPR